MKASLPAVAVLSVMLTAPWAGAQTVYRCGSSYSQAPCPAGTAIETGDTRTAGQKQQADAATQRDARLASAMEKSRLKEEALAARHSKAAPKEKPVKESTKPTAAKKKKKAEDAPTLYSPALAAGKPAKAPKTPRKQAG